MLSIQPKTNTVVVGSADELEVAPVRCGRPVWIAPSAGWRIVRMLGAAARARHALAGPDPAASRTAVTARAAHPQRGVAAGQALVMYDGDRVLGSATITATEREAVASR